MTTTSDLRTGLLLLGTCLILLGLSCGTCTDDEKHDPYTPGVGGVSNPLLTSHPPSQPVYPAGAKAEKIESDVTLKAVITRDGSVGEIEVLSCDQPGHGFEEAAIAAVSQWKYDPATLDGKPVDVHKTFNISFSLE